MKDNQLSPKNQTEIFFLEKYLEQNLGFIYLVQYHTNEGFKTFIASLIISSFMISVYALMIKRTMNVDNHFVKSEII